MEDKEGLTITALTWVEEETYLEYMENANTSCQGPSVQTQTHISGYLAYKVCRSTQIVKAASSCHPFPLEEVAKAPPRSTCISSTS